MDRFIYDISNLDMILLEIQLYIQNTEDVNEQIAYTAELNEVKNNWEMLVESGVFHDAIGKVVNKKFNEVEVAIEY